MKTSRGPGKTKRRTRVARSVPSERVSPARAVEAELTGRRQHGDSYFDVSAREADLVATVSSHVASVDRHREEPADSIREAHAPLEDGA